VIDSDLYVGVFATQIQNSIPPLDSLANIFHLGHDEWTMQVMISDL